MYVRVLEQFCKEYGEPSKGFNPDKAYRVHQIAGVGDEASVVLVNESSELCWVDPHHLRVISEDEYLRSRTPDLSLPIRIPQSGPYTA